MKTQWTSLLQTGRKYSKFGREERAREEKPERGKTNCYYIWHGMAFKGKFVHYAYGFIAA